MSSKKKFLVIGLGMLGQKIATTLYEEGAEVIAMDEQQDLVTFIKDRVTLSVAGDATDELVLQDLEVQDLDAVIIAIGEAFEAAVLCAALLVEMKVRKVICRANSEREARILKKIGVHEVVFVEASMGKAIAHMASGGAFDSEFRIGDNHRILRWEAPKELDGKTLSELNLQKRFGINVVAVSDKETGEIHVAHGDTKIHLGSRIWLFGHDHHVNRLESAFSKS